MFIRHFTKHLSLGYKYKNVGILFSFWFSHEHQCIVYFHIFYFSRLSRFASIYSILLDTSHRHLLHLSSCLPVIWASSYLSMFHKNSTTSRCSILYLKHLCGIFRNLLIKLWGFFTETQWLPCVKNILFEKICCPCHF